MAENGIVNFIAGCWLVAKTIVANAVGFVEVFIGPYLAAAIVAALVAWWCATH